MPKHSPRASRLPLAIATVLCAAASTANAQSGAKPVDPADATQLVRHAVENWAQAQKNHHPLEYIVHRIDERHDSTKAIIETADGDVARLIAINGKPLDSDATQAEFARLDTLAAHPELQEKRRRSEDKDRDRITHLLNQLPDAFLYKYEGNVACASGQCEDFSFIPNPQWSAPDLESGIFRGLAGQLWIDPSAQTLVRLDCHFISDADVGFGLIGRINKGGTAFLEQSAIGNNDWELTQLTVHVTGKAFVFKSFIYQVDERTSHFMPVATGLHYRDAIKMLRHIEPSTMLPEATH